MAYDLLAMLAAGFGAAGVLLILRLISRGRLPKWLVPAGAGAAMIAFSAWNEYTWYPRIRAALPESVRIVTAPVDTVPYQPWTYLFPLTKRFMAVDLGSAVHSEIAPDQFVAPVIIVTRWGRTERLPVAFDCAGGRRANVFLNAADGAGGIEGAEWETPDAGDELLAAACNGG
jgi:hypothetical protein